MDAGFATTVVASNDREPTITVAKRGEERLVNGPGWGQYSAVDFVDDTAWFASNVVLQSAPSGFGSWITTEEL